MTNQPTPLTPDQVNAIVRDMDDPRYPTQITVFCDHCGTEDTGEYMVSEGMTSRERLAVARDHLVKNKGWQHDADTGDDFCPEHAAPAADDEGLSGPCDCGEGAVHYTAAECPAAQRVATSTVEERPAACGKCKTPFDPADTRHDGNAREGITSFCRRCVDRCHENSDAFHVCAVCREGGE
ncbi:MAG: hypothetical protein HOV92_17980 [Streptomyces sp.]|nr:hypothetical protein [Streptomyces sp.]